MPGVAGLLLRRLTVVSCRARRTVTGAVQPALVSLARIRSCPTCRAWIAPDSAVCPAGHRMD
ncbi:hypothetical protein [Streptomyces sp. XY006]|uniref:hypothetical protein n=1 Tax=Streptomyces sp. XY006 TaxID=2021410 RepID=UPI000B8BB58F|nr:hypothetical protein [Streptomyces sp. XY006]OXS30585.1 hypothetical protein CHR28_35720 [Streptomyces sp. XY006]